MKHVTTKAALLSIAILAASSLAHALTYKTAADTAALNAQHQKLTTEIADLNNQLNAAKNKLLDYQSKSTSGNQDAQAAAQASKDQAPTAASNDNLMRINKEEKKAKEANSEADDAKDAQVKLKDQNKKINKLSSEIDKKQKKPAWIYNRLQL